MNGKHIDEFNGKLVSEDRWTNRSKEQRALGLKRVLRILIEFNSKFSK